MSINNFVPELWADQVQAAYLPALVFGAVCNRDYEGTISQHGDTVHINGIGPVTIKDYTPNVDIDAAEQLNDESRVLKIDQAKYYNYKVDDVDRRQATGNMATEANRRAGHGMAATVDTYIASLYTEAGQKANGGVAVAINSQNVLAWFQAMGEALDNADVPDDGRWANVPPWIVTKLQLAKLLIGDGSNLAASAVGSRVLGEVAGFQIRKTTKVSNDGTTWQTMFGTTEAITLADQFIKTEAYRIEKGFGDGVKGLNVYGAKVVRPAALGVLPMTVGLEP